MTEGHIDYDGWTREMLPHFDHNAAFARAYIEQETHTLNALQADFVATYGPLPESIKEPLPMTNWLYIETRMIDGMVSFAHLFLEATDTEDAYHAGQYAMECATHGNLVEGDFLNDYVIELENN